MTMPALAPRPILEQFDDNEGRLCYRFTLFADVPPRTKKNSSQASRTGQVCRACGLRKGPARVFPSKAFREYQAAVAAYVATKPILHLKLVAPVAMRALVYRDRASGDYFGFMQALGDVLQHCGIIENDRQIMHTDGSRLLKDAANPRVEITLTVIGDTQLEIGGDV